MHCRRRFCKKRTIRNGIHAHWTCALGTSSFGRSRRPCRFVAASGRCLRSRGPSGDLWHYWVQPQLWRMNLMAWAKNTFNWNFELCSYHSDCRLSWPWLCSHRRSILRLQSDLQTPNQHLCRHFNQRRRQNSYRHLDCNAVSFLHLAPYRGVALA